MLSLSVCRWLRCFFPLVLALFFASICPAQDAFSIVGTWSGGGSTPDPNDQGIAVFNSDGTYSLSANGGRADRGTYTFSGTTLTLRNRRGPSDITVTILDDDHFATQSSLGSATFSRVAGAQKLKHRAFFYICYLNTEKNSPVLYQSFVDAAATWEREIKARYIFTPGQDTFIEGYALTATKFVKTWNDIQIKITKGDYNAVAGGLFTHASEPISSHGVTVNTGLEFASEPGQDPQIGSTVTLETITSLPRLNWDPHGFLQLFGVILQPCGA